MAKPKKPTETKKSTESKETAKPTNSQYRNYIANIAQVLLLGWLIWSVVDKNISALEGLILWVLGGATLAFLIRLYYSIMDKELPGIETFWGGIDGGLGGWQISRSLTYLLLVGLFGLLFLFSSSKFLTEEVSKTTEEVVGEMTEEPDAAEEEKEEETEPTKQQKNEEKPEESN